MMKYRFKNDNKGGIMTDKEEIQKKINEVTNE